jgi:hypothetical protein
MSIKSPEELAGLRAAGAVVRRMLEAMKQAVRAGITTAELDQVGATIMRQHGARSAPRATAKSCRKHSRQADTLDSGHFDSLLLCSRLCIDPRRNLSCLASCEAVTELSRLQR